MKTSRRPLIIPDVFIVLPLCIDVCGIGYNDGDEHESI